MKKGISLIVLIITIIVIVILSVTVILTLNNNNPIEAAKEARFKEDVMGFQDELNLYLANEYTSNIQNGETPMINASKYAKNSEKDSVYTYVSSFKKKYENKLAIKNNMIAYIGVDDKEREWLLNSGIYVSKKITVNFVDETGNKIADSYVTSVLNNDYSLEVPKVDGYMSMSDFSEGTITQDTELNVVYYKESTNLAFIGLDSSGNETTDESSIVAYTVSGMGSCTSRNIAIPREHNQKPVTKVKASAFIGTSIITNLIIEDNIELVGNASFANSTSLLNIKVNAKKLDNNSFIGGYNVQSVEIGKNVNSVTNAFMGCGKLKYCKIYSENINIYTTIFNGCTSLENILINEDNLKYISIDGVVYSKDESKLYCYPPGRTDETYNLNSSTKEIIGSAFLGSKIKRIEIPDTVDSIGEASFNQCKQLTDIKINSKKIGRLAFANCVSLKNLEIGKSVTSTGGSMFLVCSVLESISYDGTIQEWQNLVGTNTGWSGSTVLKEVICSDGTITL